jgi:hypothetical protein
MPDPGVSHSPEKDQIGLALSGGGVRAALFSLGVLLYIMRAGLSHRLGSVTSVSGGSITNAVVAAAGDFSTNTSSDYYDRIFRRYAARLASQGAFFLPTWKTLLAQTLAALLIVPVLVTAPFLPLIGYNLWVQFFRMTFINYVIVFPFAFALALLITRRQRQELKYNFLIGRSIAPGMSKRALKQPRRLVNLPVIYCCAHFLRH